MTAPTDLAVRLYASWCKTTGQDLLDEKVWPALLLNMPAMEKTRVLWEQIAACAEAIIAERVREAREAEREKVAEFMLAHSFATGHGDTTDDLLVELGPQIAETCAVERKEALRECYNAVCEQFLPLVSHTSYNQGVTACRDAIAKLIEGETP